MQVRCPHCHNPIDVVNDDPSGDVSCPSCGSCFNLAKDGQTLTTDGPPAKMLGHFQLLHCLGQGAFGTVWKARDTKLDRIVAIKIPRKEHLTEADVEKFLREARAAAQVRHPNIVSVHEVGREDGRIYIASDFIDGASLDDWIQAHPLTVRESVELCATIAEALHHAHEAGVVHRDLKPQNILVTLTRRASEASDTLATSDSAQTSDASLARRVSVPEPSALTPFITDFGLAKRDAGEITMTIEGAILGTPAYMPPEQARGEAHHADRRSDVYSLGVILFRLLTGELPFRGQRQMLILQILSEEPPALRKLDARLPRDVETICLKCLEKDPARRYQSAAALAADLRRWLTGHPIQARPVGRTERAWRWCRRNPSVASLSAAVVLVLLTGIAVSSFFALEAASRNRDLLRETTRANMKADEARRRLYLSQMNLAQAAWQDSRVGRLRELLKQQEPQWEEPDLRGFEWLYWNRLSNSYALNIQGHDREVTSCAFSPDGKRLASASLDQTVKVWDTLNGVELLALKGHTDSVMCVSFSPSGKWLASGSDDQTVKLWNTTTGTESFTLKGHNSRVTSIAFSPDGKWLAAASGNDFKTAEPGQVKIWDVESGRESFTLKGKTGELMSVAFSPDGKQLASGSRKGTVTLWNATNGVESLNLKGHAGAVPSVAFSPDGKRLASASYDLSVKVWDLTSGAENLTLKGHTHWLTSVAFSPDGNRLASAGGYGDRVVKLWDVTTGDELFALKGHSSGIASVAFSPDGRRLASASHDRTVKVWNTTTGTESLALEGHSSGVWNVAFSPDGKRLASASHDRTVKVWDLMSGTELLTLKGHSSQVWSVAFSPDGRRLASASDDQTVKTWDVTSGTELLTLKGHTGAVMSVAISPDGKRLASASSDGTLKVWNVMNGVELLTLRGHKGGVTAVAFSSDGHQLASASNDQMVKIWDPINGTETITLKGHTSGVTSLSFSPDRKWLASASWDWTVKIWDTSSGAESLTLKGHTGGVYSVAFSPDGKRLASASYDHTAKVWDPTIGIETLTLTGHILQVHSVAFCPDGNRLATASSDQTVRVWDARPWTPELQVEREALSLIHFLRYQGQPRSEWLNAISSDQTISEPVRQRALQFAREWKPEAPSKEPTK